MDFKAPEATTPQCKLAPSFDSKADLAHHFPNSSLSVPGSEPRLYGLLDLKPPNESGLLRRPRSNEGGKVATLGRRHEPRKPGCPLSGSAHCPLRRRCSAPFGILRVAEFLSCRAQFESAWRDHDAAAALAHLSTRLFRWHRSGAVSWCIHICLQPQSSMAKEDEGGACPSGDASIEVTAVCIHETSTKHSRYLQETLPS